VQVRQQEQIPRAIETRGDCWIQELRWPTLFIENLTAEGESRLLVGGAKAVMPIGCSSPSSITARRSSWP
jgi:hypothetical protein